MRRHLYGLILPGLLFLCFFMVVPILLTIASTLFPNSHFGFGEYSHVLGDRYFLKILSTTLGVSAVCTIGCAILGFPTSYYISRRLPRSKGVLLALAVFPLLTSPVVRSFSWMIILGRKGLLNTVLADLGLVVRPLNILYTPSAIVVGLVHLFLPMMIISLVGVLESIDEDLIEAAESLGASPLAAFRQVVFPLAIPGLVVGSVLVFVGSLTAYTTPALLGGKQRVLSTFLYENAMTLNDWSLASVIATIMIVVTLLVVTLMNRASATLGRSRT